ncbi:MBL fold metallo-hydrolase [Prevotella falsenii]|uniref:MBL fold metallo-hydrolase n=1 Tax=Prevotella falsenii TaxID=515414 RepID=UPI0018DB72C2|nr:MBL fold metallo-hydrolase [Prevotella falsenii]
MEKFELPNGSTFTIVYDCGSLTLKQEELKKRIKGVFPKGHQIDILFISHFHADHINGIEALKEHCRIKKVVLPLIDDEEKIILKVSNYIETKDSCEEIIETPEQYFENSIIIKINPVDMDSTPKDVDPIDISNIEENTTLSSGTVLKDKRNGFLDWVFIPYNYKQNERKNQFKRKIKFPLKKITIDNIEEYKDKLTDAYKAIEGDLNGNSMALYSGPLKDNYSFLCYRYRPFYTYCLDPYQLQSGCLYTGDVNLKNRGLIKDIKERLDRVSQFIGTLQVPHHGSEHNFKESILKIGKISSAVCSFGIRNSYGHPAYTVIEKVVDKEIIPCLVTEDFGTIVVQEGFFYEEI